VISTTTRDCGARKCSKVNFLRVAVIETMVSVEGYMATRGKLRGEKWVGPKPLLGVPTIVHLRKDIARGHM
jgi:hypothetical protein